MTTKSELRKAWRQKVDRLSSVRKQEAKDALFERLSKRLSGPTLSFASRHNEIDLWPVNHWLVKQNWLSLPRVEHRTLAVHLVTDIAQDLLLSAWNVLEPRPEICPPIDPRALQFVLVPALAFDVAHHRLGLGKGYYDMFLAKHPTIHSIGVSYREQMCPELLPHESWDIPVHELILV
ncbi:MAG: hypothetical protein RL235_454 [Chlamydiota bacterium]